jgi:hypothetical protein
MISGFFFRGPGVFQGVLIKKLLLDDDVQGTCVVMDNHYMPGLILPPESAQGRGRLRRLRKMLWTPDVFREWKDPRDLERAFVRALIEAAGQHTGAGVLSVDTSHISRYFEFCPEGPQAFLVRPSEALAWGFKEPEAPDLPWVHEGEHPRAFRRVINSQYVPVPVYTMKAVPPKTILALSYPEFVGTFSHSRTSDRDTVLRGEFCIVPTYVYGLRRAGKIPK